MSKEIITDKELDKLYKLLNKCIVVFIIYSVFAFYYLFNPKSFEHLNPKPTNNVYVDHSIENGIHVSTGLIDADGLMTVVDNCTNCHSAKLIMQNRMTKEGWNNSIKWMQETQNLWDLGEDQKTIVNYLVTNYPPKPIGRRAPLMETKWYKLHQ